MLNAGFGLRRRDVATQTDAIPESAQASVPVHGQAVVTPRSAQNTDFDSVRAENLPTPGAGSLTLVITSHPTSVFSRDLEADVRRKVGRNREHRYDRLEQVRGKYGRYLQKRIAFLERVKTGDADWSQDFEGLRHGLSASAVGRLHKIHEMGKFPILNVRNEAGRALQQIEQVIVASYRVATESGAEAAQMRSGLNQLKTWASRDNDRSTVVFGDHTHVFAAQVERSCKVYQKLLEGHAVRFPGLPAAELQVLLQRCTGIARHLRVLIRQAGREPGALQACLARFLCDPKNAIAPIEDRILVICETQADGAFSQVFSKCRITGFAGEVRINAAGLDEAGTPAERGRVAEVLHETRLIDHCYPDTRSIVIADFSRLEQVTALKQMLSDHAAGIEVIPLLERPVDIEYFIDNALAFKQAGIRTVMLAGSDLVRVAGTPLAITLRHRMNQACVDQGLVSYQGIGSSARRNGVGLAAETLLDDTHARLFLPAAPDAPQEYRYTLQGGDAVAALGNPELARRSLQRRLVAIPVATAQPAASAVSAAEQAVQAAAVFAPITAREMAMREDDGDFARFYRRHGVILDMRNNSVHHGSRDAVKPGLRHLYQDRAINSDASIELFNLTATFAWGDLAADPDTMRRMVSDTRRALCDGNPVVQDILLNYGLQAGTLFFEDQCHEKWQAAGFSAEAIERLAASRAAMLGFLGLVGHGLGHNPPLQRYLLEYLGIGGEVPVEQSFRNMDAIEARRRQCNDAGIAALRALRERDDMENTAVHRKIAALELHLQLSAAYVHGLGVKS